MDKYELLNNRDSSRAIKNQDIYNELDDYTITNIKSDDNVVVLDSVSKSIDINRVKELLNNNVQNDINYKNSTNYEDDLKIDEDIFNNNEEKIYDINIIMEKAKNNREVNYDIEKYKKIRYDDYKLLEKIKNCYDTKKEIEEKMAKIANTLTIEHDNNLLSSLSSDNEQSKVLSISKEIKSATFLSDELEEKEETQLNIKTIEQSFYTNSMNFDKDDFEGFEELEKSVKKHNVLMIILIIVISAVVIASALIVLKTVFNVNIF